MKKEKVIDIINKLLTTAEDKGATENEALMAALKAQELMAKYNLTVEDIQTDYVDEIIECGVETGTGNSWKYVLANCVAPNFCCKVFAQNRTKIMFYGFRKNCEVACQVFRFLFNMGNKFATRCYFKVRNSGQNTKGVKNAFLLGYVQGVKSVLEKQCTALMLVVPQEVDEAYKTRMNNSRSIRPKISYTNEKEYYDDGYTTGRNTAQSRYLE